MSQSCIQATDKTIGVYIVGGLFDLVARSAFKPDIGLDVSSEEKDILLHYANTTTQSLNIPLANIDSIDEDLLILDFVKATDLVHHYHYQRYRRQR